MGLIDIIKPPLSTALSNNPVDKPRQHQKTLGMPGIKFGTAGCEAQTLPLSYAIPNSSVSFNVGHKFEYLHLGIWTHKPSYIANLKSHHCRRLPFSNNKTN